MPSAGLCLVFEYHGPIDHYDPRGRLYSVLLHRLMVIRYVLP